MKNKTFKTLDEQIAILKAKNVVVDDYDYVKDILLRENYFFISGYRHLFVKSVIEKNYIENTNFRELYAMFYFDRQLRNILFKNILIVENNIKSILSYIMSKNHGFKEQNYLNPNNFIKDSRRNKQVNDLLKKMHRQIRVNGKQHTATSHYINNYGYIPLWVVVKVLSFGIVGELYTILKAEDQKEIADVFKVSVDNMLDFLPILANYRNLCAHEDICYEHRTQKEIANNRFHELLDIPKMDGEYIYGKNDLFSLVLILKHLLSHDDFTLMLNEMSFEIDLLAGRLKVINITKVLDKMGFPLNYQELARMN
ncbi:MAG: Abi family protein [Bacilli bacterium]|nr:Abi family protein [Bacilli bacterium]